MDYRNRLDRGRLRCHLTHAIMLRGYNKTTDLGTHGCLIAPAASLREGICRPTNLPLNWRRVCISMFFRWISGTDDNGDPVAETMPSTWTNFLDDFSIGISNGVGLPGESGNRYVGIGRATGAQMGIGINAKTSPVISTVQGFRYMAPRAVIGDGATLLRASAGPSGSDCYSSLPSTAHHFAAFAAVDLELTATGLRLNRWCVGHNADAATGFTPGFTDCSEYALRSVLYGTRVTVNTSTAEVAGGWWTSGADVGIRHLLVRSPYYLNRLCLDNALVERLG